MIGILAGHQPVLGSRTTGYMGRLTIEVYDNISDVHIGYGGPEMMVGHWPDDAKGRAAHALAIESAVLRVAQDGQSSLTQAGYSLSPLPDVIRSVAPASSSNATHFVGRTVVERWQDGEMRVAVHIAGSAAINEAEFAKKSLDRAVTKLLLVTQVLRSRSTALRHHQGQAKHT